MEDKNIKKFQIDNLLNALKSLDNYNSFEYLGHGNYGVVIGSFHTKK